MKNRTKENAARAAAEVNPGFKKHPRVNLFQSLFIFCVLFSLLLFSAALNAQDLPDEIRGYKVSDARITVKPKSEKTGAKDKSEVYVNTSDPELINISLTGLTFEITAEIDPLEQSGTVHFLTFKDFRVNGMSVDLEEYQNSFDFKKNKPIVLPKPVRVFVNSAQSLLGAASEIGRSQEEWTVTGRMFVFGKFKKFGLNFKRVVPVDINIKIKNPIKKPTGVF